MSEITHFVFCSELYPEGHLSFRNASATGDANLSLESCRMQTRWIRANRFASADSAGLLDPNLMDVDPTGPQKMCIWIGKAARSKPNRFGPASARQLQNSKNSNFTKNVSQFTILCKTLKLRTFTCSTVMSTRAVGTWVGRYVLLIIAGPQKMCIWLGEAARSKPNRIGPATARQLQNSKISNFTQNVSWFTILRKTFKYGIFSVFHCDVHSRCWHLGLLICIAFSFSI